MVLIYTGDPDLCRSFTQSHPELARDNRIVEIKVLVYSEVHKGERRVAPTRKNVLLCPSPHTLSPPAADLCGLGDVERVGRLGRGPAALVGVRARVVRCGVVRRAYRRAVAGRRRLHDEGGVLAGLLVLRLELLLALAEVVEDDEDASCRGQTRSATRGAAGADMDAPSWKHQMMTITMTMTTRMTSKPAWQNQCLMSPPSPVDPLTHLSTALSSRPWKSVQTK